MYESFVNCESMVAAEAVLVILGVRNQLIFGHKNRFRDAVNQVDGTKVLEEVIGGEVKVGGKVKEMNCTGSPRSPPQVG